MSRRTNVMLDAQAREHMRIIAAHLGLDPTRGGSAAIRYALREAAERIKGPPPVPTKRPRAGATVARGGTRR